MNLPPGRYQLRVAAGNKTGKAGSVLYDLDVPDFYKAPFAMSGVSITSALGTAGADAEGQGSAGRLPAGPPMATREFAANDTLALFAEFYENAGNDAGAYRGPDGGAARRGRRRGAREPRGALVHARCGGGGGYGFAARLPLEGLRPGVYVLHVQRAVAARTIGRARRATS